jgi:hypothetical protein
MKLRGTLNYPSFQPAPLIIDQNVVFIHPHTFSLPLHLSQWCAVKHQTTVTKRLLIPQLLPQHSILTQTMTNQAQQKTYHKKASGQALNTVKKHSKETDLKLFGSCFWYFLPPFHYLSI